MFCLTKFSKGFVNLCYDSVVGYPSRVFVCKSKPSLILRDFFPIYISSFLVLLYVFISSLTIDLFVIESSVISNPISACTHCKVDVKTFSWQSTLPKIEKSWWYGITSYKHFCFLFHYFFFLFFVNRLITGHTIMGYCTSVFIARILFG